MVRSMRVWSCLTIRSRAPATQPGRVSRLRHSPLIVLPRIVPTRVLPWWTGRRLQLTLAGVLLALALASSLVAARADNDELSLFGELTFHIPSQPLPAALQLYSQVSGVQVLYETSSAHGRLSHSVEGTYTRDTALRLLLSDTDLVVRYTRADAITLTPLSLQAADEAPTGSTHSADLVLDTMHIRAAHADDLSRLRSYSRVIENDVTVALKGNPRTKVGSYRVGVRLWIDQDRTITRTELFHSSGDKERDAAISSVLGGLVISAASPENTPQPVALMISVNSVL
jgi:hypothetical protein